MLRIVDQFWGTDTGRQRHHNEDSYYAKPPLFVVADGMGGAQAGEVASDMVVQAFRAGLPASGSAEERLAGVIRTANERIHETARADKQRAGMGTTSVAALLGEHDLAVAHVGDSRAYLLRAGELRPLTRDHSLVQTLIDQGRLSVEDAQFHPQRSIITRALGPEPEVDVETRTYGLYPGDVVLLCSDGLTSMIEEPLILDTLRAHEDLDAAGRGLIAAANAAGGRDNITVILFRIGGEGEPASASASQTTQAYAPVVPDEPPARDERTLEAPAIRRRAPEPAPEDAPAPAPAPAPGEERPAKPVTAFIPAVRAPSEPVTPPSGQPQPPSSPALPPPTTIPPAAAVPVRERRLQPTPPPEPPGDSSRGRGRPRGARRRRLTALAVVAVIAALILGGGWLASRDVFFVGTNDQGLVTIFRGVPYDLPLGVRLYEQFYVSGVPAQDVPAARLKKLLNHSWRSQKDAESLIDQLELGKLAGQ